MEAREFRMAWQTAAARLISAGGLGLVVACASGGSTPASSGASTAPASISPVSDGDIERTQFSPSLGVDITKMMRRNSGLYVQDLQTGTGAVAAQTRTAVVRYTGYLPNGKEFDSGEITISIGAGKVIRAWDEGVLGMRVGGKRRLVSPPHLAYGSRGAPPTIPANAVLVFDMELTQVY
jgi:FKBP-type peptidyl-prolyl cis-trans isomerase FkpA